MSAEPRFALFFFFGEIAKSPIKHGPRATHGAASAGARNRLLDSRLRGPLRTVMSREAATAADGGSAPPAGDEAGGYLGTISSLFTSLAADASASARGAEDRVLDSVEKLSLIHI